MGESIVKTSLGGTYYSGFYVDRHLVSTGIPRAFKAQNRRGLQPIITELYPWTARGWEHFIERPPMDSSADFCSVCVVTARVTLNSPVCSNIIMYLTTSANIDIAPGPFATAVRRTGVPCGIQNTYPWHRLRLASPNI
jgi:hypothetical protein